MGRFPVKGESVSPIPVDVQRLIYRIHLIDQLDRRKRGYKRATRGLYRRLAETFNVPHHAVERICCRLKIYSKKRRYFVKIDGIDERQKLRKRRKKYADT